MRYIIVILLLALNFSAQAANKNRPYNLVCFEKEGLTKVLDQVVNAQQILRNSLGQTVTNQELNKLACDYAQIPSGSKARFSGLHQTDRGFIFPVYRVTYSTTRQRMYSTEGIYLSEYWKVGKRAYRDFMFPKSCEALDGLVNRRKLPSYVMVPRHCEERVIE